MLFSLLTCYPIETGIDSTLLTGTVTLPADPETFEESNDPAGLNSRDRLDKADEIGELGWRHKQATGAFREWPANPDDPTDEDFYLFEPIGSGSFTITLALHGTTDGPPAPDTGTDDTATDDTATDDTADTGEPGPAYEENRVAGLRLFDPGVELGEDELPTPLAEVLTAGGSAVLSFEAEAGKEYAFSVEGLQNLDGEPDGYTVWLSGSNPADAGIKIGAYLDASDYQARGALAGGSNVTGWLLEGTTWTGSYTMTFFKTVESGEAVNSYGETIDSHTVIEGAETVYLVGGTFKSLNEALPAGTLHNSTPVQVDLKPNKANEADPVVLDQIAPKVIGWTTEEVEPNNVGFLDEGGLDLANIGEATPLPIGSGLGFVDVINGVQTFHDVMADGADSTGSDENNDIDVYAMTVPEALDVVVTMSWPTTANLDGYLADDTGTFVAAGYAIGDVNPEFYPVSAFGITLEPDRTYYLVVLPWEGDAGDHAYTIELEWIGL